MKRTVLCDECRAQQDLINYGYIEDCEVKVVKCNHSINVKKSKSRSKAEEKNSKSKKITVITPAPKK
jgi:hypothetical protein